MQSTEIKTDNRHYNKKAKRDLGIEMDLWCLLNGKHIEVTGAYCENKPVKGLITSTSYEPCKGANFCRLIINGTIEYTLRVKHGKPIITDEIKITNEPVY